MAEADRITQEQWKLGLEGTGYFAMVNPLNTVTAKVKAEWHIGGNLGDNRKAAELKLNDLVEVDTKIQQSEGLQNFIKNEEVITNETARSILQEVVDGKYIH